MVATVTLSICCVCKKVSDERIGTHVEWTNLHAYLVRHHIDQDGVQLSHTYCPSCYKRQARAWRVPSTSSRNSRIKRAI
jgi:hypothetical protein